MALRLLATLCLAIVATTANADVNVAKGRAAAAVFDFSCLQNWQNTDQALSEFVRIVGRAGTQYADREGISVEASGIALSVSPVGYPMREHMAMPNDPLVAAAIVCSVSLTDLNDGVFGVQLPNFISALDQVIQAHDPDAKRTGDAEFYSSLKWSFTIDGSEAIAGAYSNGCCTPVFYLDIPSQAEK